MTNELTHFYDRNIYLVRHGSVHNPGGLVYGRLPGFPLSVQGREEAASAAGYLQAFGIRSVVSSQQERALETAGIISETCGCCMVVDCRLGEVASTDEGQVFSPKGDSILDRPLHDSKPFGTAMETCGSVVDRVQAALIKALNSTPDDVALVSHEVPIMLLLRSMGVERGLVAGIREGEVVRIFVENGEPTAQIVHGR